MTARDHRKRRYAWVRIRRMGRRIVKALVSACVHATDAMLGRKHGVVLYYHGIRAGERAAFMRQMREVARRPRARVTFDDAMESLIDRALPVMEQLGIPATIFVPTAYLGRPPGWMAPENRNGDCVMSAGRIMQYARNDSISWGSHSVTHPRFVELAEEEARRELRDSRAALERVLGRPVTAFSFPHGSYGERDIRLAEELGYQGVYTAMPHAERMVGGVHVIGRIRVDPSDWPWEFRLKLAGAYRWLPWASAMKERFLTREATR